MTVDIEPVPTEKCFLFEEKIPPPTVLALSNLKHRYFEYNPVVHYEIDPPPYDSGASIQVILLPDVLPISELVPKFRGTLYDHILLSNVALIRRPFDDSAAAALTLAGDLKFDPSHREVHTVLTNVLGVSDPTLQVTCDLGSTYGWGPPLKLSGFTLEGTFSNVRASPSKGFTFTDIGIHLSGVEDVQYAPDGSLSLHKTYSYRVFGTMEIRLQKWENPLILSYEIAKEGEVLRLSAGAELWVKAFGFEKLTLRNVAMDVEFTPEAGLSTAVLGLQAVLEYGGTPITITGELSMEGTFWIEATINNLTFQTIDNIYSELYNKHLPPLDRQFSVGNTSLRVSSDGVSLKVKEFVLDTYPAADGAIELGPEGVHLSVQASGGQISITDEVKIYDPFIKLSFGRSDGVSTGELALHGIVKWESFTLLVDAHIYKVSDVPGIQYTVFGRFVQEDPNATGLRFGKLVPALEDVAALRDITLKDAAVIIASRTGAEFPFDTSVAYKVRSGFFVYSKLDIPGLGSATGNDSTLTLSAGWSKHSGFLIGIEGPDSMKLKLSPDVETEPIKVVVELGPPPSFALECGLTVFMEKPNDDLKFKLLCAVETTGDATLKGTMEGMWNNPFGLSRDLKVGNLTLGVRLILASGTPSGLDIGGTIQLRESIVAVRLSVCKDPKKMFMRILAKDLKVRDLVEMANILAGCHLTPPPDVFECKDLLFYACPSDTVIDGKDYPRGFAFRCTMVIFGRTAGVLAEINSGGVTVAGFVDEFELGGFKVTGVSGTRASFALVLRGDEQYGNIDGVILLPGNIRAALKADFRLRPQLHFSFYFDLQIDNIFHVTVLAAPVTAITEGQHDISKQVYEISASVETHVLQEVLRRVSEELKELGRQADTAAKQAGAAIEQKQRELHEGLDLVCGRLNEWRERSPYDQDRVIRELLKVLRIELSSRPAEARKRLTERLDQAVNTLKDKTWVWQNARNIWHNERLRVERELKASPLPDILVGWACDFAERVAPVVDDSLRRDWKRAEGDCLWARVTLLEVMREMAPQRLADSLWPFWNQAREVAEREAGNDALTDALEEIRDLALQAVASIVELVVQLAGQIVDFAASGLEMAVDVANGATQTLLKFADGLITSVLDSILITRMFIKTILGGNEIFTFDATIEGTIKGKPFTFQMRVSFADFWAFIKELFERLKEWILQQFVH